MYTEGNILKMRSELANPVRYFLPVGETEIAMNDIDWKGNFNEIYRTNQLHFMWQANQNIVQPGILL